MKNLIVEYPLWTVVLCPMVGAIVAGVLYYSNKRTGEMPTWLVWLLGCLRFVLVTAIAFLLLGPLVKYLDTTVEAPVVVLASDNSTSVILGGDSAQSAAKAKAVNNLVKALNEGLQGKYETTNYTFGQQVDQGRNLDFTEPVTDISALFASLKNRYANRNLGAVILLSDGIYNRGGNPRYATEGIRAPVFTVALGDTTLRRDLRIVETGANRIAFLNNKFPIEARVAADKLEGRSLYFSVSEGGKTLYGESVDVDSENFDHDFRARIDANTPGTHHYVLKVEAGGDADEITLANNVRSVYVDVIDSRRKVLILAEAPHPDVNALRDAIQSNQNYEVSARLASEFRGKLQDYDLVLTHNLPGKSSAGRQLAVDLAASELPFMSVVGLQTDPTLWGNMPTGLMFSGGNVKFNDVKGLVNRDFAKFTLPNGLGNMLEEAPPVQVPFGAQTVGPAVQSVLFQRIGPVDTHDPLLTVREVNGRRSAAFAGEGMWRWRIYDYALHQNHDLFDAMINAVIQYLALKEDRRFFRVGDQDEYMENERITLSAELYDESYEPTTDSEVTIDITDAEGRVYPFVFAPSGAAYHLDAGVLPVGQYTYTARTERGGKKYSDTGRFIVTPFALESANLTANRNVLRAVSAATGGQMFSPDEIQNLLDRMTSEGQVLKPVSYTSELLRSLLEFKWIFWILLALLSVEWFARKRAGFY